MTFTDVIAGIALFVSVGSLVSAQMIAKRQRTFELRFYRLSMLDPAKGALRRIRIDMTRRTNIIDHVQQGRLLPLDLEALNKLDREAVNTFHAISHHLPPDRREVLEAKRTDLERKLMQRLHLDDQQFYDMAPQVMKTYVDAVVLAVEDRLRALLDSD